MGDVISAQSGFRHAPRTCTGRIHREGDMNTLKTGTPQPGRGGIVGSLADDLAELARKVHGATSRFDITVWADVEAHVFFERADRSPEVPSAYVAGTYGAGSVPDDIESDLHVLRKERIPASMLRN
jgi:hypothetical protein